MSARLCVVTVDSGIKTAPADPAMQEGAREGLGALVPTSIP